MILQLISEGFDKDILESTDLTHLFKLLDLHKKNSLFKDTLQFVINSH